MDFKQNLLVIDFNNLMFRSLSIMKYSSSVPIKFDTEDECASFAAKLTQDLLYIIKMFHCPGQKVVLACDSPNSWRKDIYENYKEGRTKPDYNLKNVYASADRVKEIFSDNGAVVLSAPKTEGDDIISICKKLVWDEPEFSNTNINIVSADADVRQLVDFQEYSQKYCAVYNEVGRGPQGTRRWYMSKKTVEWLNSNTSNVIDFFDFNIDSNKSYIKNIINTNKKIVIEECDAQDVVLNKVLSGDTSDAIESLYWCYGKTGKKVKISPTKYTKIIESLNVHTIEELDAKKKQLKPVLETVFKKPINDMNIEERWETQKKLVWLNPNIFPESIRKYEKEFKSQILENDFSDFSEKNVKSMLKGTEFETVTEKRKAKDADIFKGLNKYIDNLNLTELF